MSAEKFENFKKALKAKKAVKSLTLADQFWQYFKEISSQHYHFNRVNVEASLLKNVTQDDVGNFYKVNLHLFEELLSIAFKIFSDLHRSTKLFARRIIHSCDL